MQIILLFFLVATHEHIFITHCIYLYIILIKYNQMIIPIVYNIVYFTLLWTHQSCIEHFLMLEQLFFFFILVCKSILL